MKLIRKMIYFVGFSILVYSLTAVLYFFINNYNFDDLPSLPISNSYTLNEKIKFLHDKENNPKILSIGSSMTLNNLDSELIIQKFNSNSYLNLSSWGVSMKDNFDLLKIITVQSKPKFIILACNILDFHNNNKCINFTFLQKYLNKEFYFLEMLQSFKLKYYLNNLGTSKRDKCFKNHYNCLSFDNFGFASLESHNFKINEKRWSDFNKNELRNRKYLYFDSIAIYCNKNNIDFIILETPIRNGITSKLDKSDLYCIEKHRNTLNNVLSKHNLRQVITIKTDWSDNLFVDPTHLNSKGSKIITKLSLEKLELH